MKLSTISPKHSYRKIRILVTIRIVLILQAFITSSRALDTNSVVILVTDEKTECVLQGDTSSSAYFWKDEANIDNTAKYMKEQSSSHYQHSYQSFNEDKIFLGTPSTKMWLPMVVHRKWEELEVIQTSKENVYDFPQELPPSPCNIGVSILSPTDEDVFLCETNTTAQEKCYVLNIKTEPTMMALKHCPDKAKSDNITGSCTTLQAKMNKVRGEISGKGWLHLIIQWNSNMKTLSVQCKEERENTMFQTLLTYDPFGILPKYLSLRSNDKSTLWKVHYYNVSSWKTGDKALRSNDKPFRSVIIDEKTNNYKSDKFCLEFFYQTNVKGASLNISVTKKSYEVEKLKFDKNGGWTRYRGIFKLTADDSFFQITIVGMLDGANPAGTTPLLLIDSVRECSQDNDNIRILTLNNSNNKTHLACQNVQDPKIIVKYVQSEETDKVSRREMMNMIELCKKIHNKTDCRNTKLCNKHGCACPIGSTGDKCKSKCPTGSYGYGCKKTCGNCVAIDCQRETGFCCSGCKPNYLAPYCKIKGESSPYLDEEDPGAGDAYLKSCTASQTGLLWSTIAITAAITAVIIFALEGSVLLVGMLRRRNFKREIIRPAPVSESSQYPMIEISAPVNTTRDTHTNRNTGKSKERLATKTKPSLGIQSMPLPATPTQTRTENTKQKLPTGSHYETGFKPVQTKHEKESFQRAMQPLPKPNNTNGEANDRESTLYLNVVNPNRDDAEYFNFTGEEAVSPQDEEEDLYENVGFQNNSNAIFKQKLQDRNNTLGRR